MPHPLVAEAARSVKELQTKHRQWYEFIQVMRRAVREGGDLTQEDRADLVYLLKQIVDMFDDVKKEANVVKEMLDAILCTVFVASNMAKPKKDKNVKGELATVTPRLTTQPHIPSPNKEPTKYGQVLQSLGVENTDVIERGILRIHWPSMVEWCTERSAEGKSLPAGIDPSKNQAGYATTARKRADVDFNEYLTRCEDVDPMDSTEREDF